MSLHVFSLACPRCSSTLHGLNGDMAFTCSRCALAYSVTDSGLQPYPMVLRAPDGVDPRSGLWMPFWELQCRPTIHAERPEDLAAYELPSQLDIFVKGFTLINVSKVGNPGLFLTERGAAPCQQPPAPFPVLVGVRRTVTMARAYAELFLLELLDRQADIEGVRVTLDITRTRLAVIYFEVKGSTFRCPATDRSYPAALIDDIVEIRNAHR